MKPDFAKAAERGLMPDFAEYSDWESMFVHKTTILPQSTVRRYLAPFSVRYRRAVRPLLRRANGTLLRRERRQT